MYPVAAVVERLHAINCNFHSCAMPLRSAFRMRASCKTALLMRRPWVRGFHMPVLELCEDPSLRVMGSPRGTTLFARLGGIPAWPSLSWCSAISHWPR